MAIIQGITPTFTFSIPSDSGIDLTACENVYVTFRQAQTLLTKTGSDIVVSENDVDVYLDQSETLRFGAGYVKVQLNWTYADGSRGATTQASINWDANLLKEVLA